uniref:Uncharacterized protein n=1 Tax=Jaculus jaculus TaxID=51337 RepID=A0A8C5NVW1_JACJA
AEFLTPAWKVISRQNTTSAATFSETNVEGNSISSPGYYVQKIEHQSPHRLSALSSLENPEIEEEMPQIVTQEPSMDSSARHKLQNLGDQEMPDGNFAAPKQSRSEEDTSGFPVLAGNSTLSGSG